MIPINLGRLKTISEVYLKVNHRQLVFSDISSAAAGVTFSEGAERLSYEPLRQAVEHYLISTELDTTTLESIQAQLRGDDRGGASRFDLSIIEHTFPRHGYDAKIFLDALSLMIKIRRSTSTE